MSELFRLRGVGKTYPGSRRAALADVDLSVRAGESLGIVGESGSGKTTLSRIMLGLLRPSSGLVEFRGRPVPARATQRDSDFRRRVQLVLQDPYSSLSPRMRVGEIIAEPIRALPGGSATPARIAELLAAVELAPELAERFPHELSGGQRQRVAIARALGPRPEVVIADEPLSALDVSVRVPILGLLRRLSADEGLTLILVSHDLGIVQRLCARTAVMHDGRIVEQGQSAQLLASPEHPYTRELLASVPTLPERMLRAAGVTDPGRAGTLTPVDSVSLAAGFPGGAQQKDTK